MFIRHKEHDFSFKVWDANEKSRVDDKYVYNCMSFDWINYNNNVLGVLKIELKNGSIIFGLSKLGTEIPQTLLTAKALLYCQFHELKSCDLIIFASAST